MKSWILIITFLISLTGLFFKTTEDGRNGVKKINKWGVLLLSLMVILFFTNIIVNNQERKDALKKLKDQKIEDSVKRYNQDVINKEVISRLKQDSIKNDTIQKLQNDLIKTSKQFNELLSEKVNSAQNELYTLRFPLDTLFLYFHLLLKIKDDEKIPFYEDALKGSPWYPSNINRYVFLKQNNSTLFDQISSMTFNIELVNKIFFPSFSFDFYNVPKLLDSSYSFVFADIPEKRNETYSALYYDHNSKRVEIVANRIKAKEIQRNGAINFRSICDASCKFSIDYPLFPNEDFDVILSKVELSNTKNDYKVSFENFRQIGKRTFDFFDPKDLYLWECLQANQCTFK